MSDCSNLLGQLRTAQERLTKAEGEIGRLARRVGDLENALGIGHERAEPVRKIQTQVVELQEIVQEMHDLGRKRMSTPVFTR